MKPKARLVIPVAVAGCLAACQSQETSVERQVLPFHVAIKRAEVTSDGMPPQLPEDVTMSETGLSLAIDRDQCTQALVTALDGTCFTKATLLEHPEARIENSAENWNYWITQAVDEGADLLLVPTVRYHPSVLTHANIWTNLGWFLFTGPVSWIADSRDYGFSVTMEVEAIDLSKWTKSKRMKESGRAEAFTTKDVADLTIVKESAKVNSEALDFVDRADNVGQWFLTVIWPAGYIAEESPSALTSLEKLLIDSQSKEIADGMEIQGPVLLEGGRLKLDFGPDQLRIQQTETGALRLKGEVILRLRGGEVEDMKSLRVQVGGAVVAEKQLVDAAITGVQNMGKFEKHYVLDEDLPSTVGGQLVRVELEDEAGTVRMFTLRAPGQRAAAASPPPVADITPAPLPPDSQPVSQNSR